MRLHPGKALLGFVLSCWAMSYDAIAASLRIHPRPIPQYWCVGPDAVVPERRSALPAALIHCRRPVLPATAAPASRRCLRPRLGLAGSDDWTSHPSWAEHFARHDRPLLLDSPRRRIDGGLDRQTFTPGLTRRSPQSGYSAAEGHYHRHVRFGHQPGRWICLGSLIVQT